MVNFFKNMSFTFKYLPTIKIFLINNKTILAYQARYISISLKKAMYIINALIFLFNAIY